MNIGEQSDTVLVQGSNAEQFCARGEKARWLIGTLSCCDSSRLRPRTVTR